MRYMTEKEFQKKMEEIQIENKQIELRNRLKAEKKKSNKFSFSKIRTSNKVLIAAIAAIILFSIACLYIQLKTGIEVSSTLITLWFSFWTVEIVSLAGIKVSKVLKNYNSVSDSESCSLDNDDAVG